MGSSSYPVFSGCSNLKTLNIGNEVKNIPPYAFYNCDGLASVTIPNSVTSIGKYAFGGTAWYNNQPDGVIYINNVLYKYKGTMPEGTSISIKDGTVSISPDAFSGCTSLTSATIPNSVTEIGYYAFYDCTGLTSVTIGNSVTSIGSGAFYGCSGLTEVTIPNPVTSIGYDAFYKCSNLKLVINFSNLTFSKGSSDYGYVAYYADRVANVPNGSIVDDFIFSKTDNTNRLVIYFGNASELILPTDFNGENYTIGDEAFYNCKGLTSVTIPNSITSIGSSAFYGCTGLTEVNISDLSAWCKISFGDAYANPLYYAKKLKLNENEIKDLVIPNDITQIKDYTFRGCTGLTSITIPNSVTSIGEFAFMDCGIRLIMNHCAIPPACGNGAFNGSYTALLMIPEGSLIDYALADEWHNFTQVHEVSEAKVSTEEKSATFEIPTIEGATQYLASVYSDATMSQLVATTQYDAYGKIIPMSTSLELSIDGFDNGVYYYKVLVKSAEGEILKNYIGTFEIDAAGIENIATDDAVEVSRYDIHGRRLNEPTRGINIVIYSDGTTRKEIIKE